MAMITTIMDITMITGMTTIMITTITIITIMTMIITTTVRMGRWTMARGPRARPFQA
ncbi:hypothetical protein FBZ90_111200 [Nitrospirillum pindoramense]|uniref:Uncharacterized protein n=1 Tax=Nitrospirillum amazonense TaxID=28077 RepID=A0A560GYT0_9PROT|nr:hypothetical protein FBZ90_111200 [Nitrospirillum amazonense]